jgi:opacity protein-like surface antigen
MTGRTLIKVCLAALGMGLASPALAADYDGQLPGEGFSGIGGCTYLRLDGGATMFDQANVDQAQVLGYDTDYGFSDGSTTGYSVAINEAIANTGFIEGGAGCQVSDSMRIEVTGGVRLKSSVSDPYVDSLSADLTSHTIFVSGFWDITNYGGFTPYIGGGVGAAYHQITDLTFPVGASDGSNWDFAYHFTAGMSYDITSALKFDLAYRYINMGDAFSGTDLAAVSGPGPITIHDISAHEVKAGLRYHFGY